MSISPIDNMFQNISLLEVTSPPRSYLTPPPIISLLRRYSLKGKNTNFFPSDRPSATIWIRSERGHVTHPGTVGT